MKLTTGKLQRSSQYSFRDFIWYTDLWSELFRHILLNISSLLKIKFWSHKFWRPENSEFSLDMMRHIHHSEYVLPNGIHKTDAISERYWNEESILRRISMHIDWFNTFLSFQLCILMISVLNLGSSRFPLIWRQGFAERWTRRGSRIRAL